MSPARARASTVAGLRRGVTGAPAAANPPTTTPVVEVGGKPARVTLNLPPDLYRQLAAWTTDAAGDLNVPRVGIQDAMRAMIAVTVTDKGIGAEVREHIRRART